jgi:hypothetical protein
MRESRVSLRAAARRNYFVSVLRSLGYRTRFRNIEGVDTYVAMAGDSRQ